MAIEHARRKWPDLMFAGTPEGASEGADLLMVLAEWTEYRTVETARVETLVTWSRVLDGRYCPDRLKGSTSDGVIKHRDAAKEPEPPGSQPIHTG